MIAPLDMKHFDIYSTKDVKDLTFVCIYYQQGMSKLTVECVLYCIEKDAYAAYGTIEWLLCRYGQEIGVNILNTEEALQVLYEVRHK